MACLHTIQIYAIGPEDHNLKVKPFNACNSTDLVDSAYNVTDVKQPRSEDLNFVHTNQNQFVIIIWSAVALAIVHVLFEMMFSTKREQSFFLWFMLSPYLEKYDSD